jgi:hypothetical protein
MKPINDYERYLVSPRYLRVGFGVFTFNFPLYNFNLKIQHNRLNSLLTLMLAWI